MAEKIKEITFKGFELSSENLVDLLSKFDAIAWKMNIEFKVEGYDWENSEKVEEKPEKVAVKIDCWEMTMKKEKKKYVLEEIKQKEEVAWYQVAILNTIFIRIKGKILWGVKDENSKGYLMKIERGKIVGKEVEKIPEKSIREEKNCEEGMENIEEKEKQYYYKEEEKVYL